MSEPATLRDALKDAEIEALFPESSPHINATPRNKRVTVYPEAVTFPKNAEEVKKIVKIGGDFKRRVVALSGGHSSIANGIGGSHGALVVDLAKLKDIEYEASSGRMTIQPGNRLEDVQAALQRDNRAIPHGVCLKVGIGGHSSFGGYGFASRMWGLNCHAIHSYKAILEDATESDLSATQKPDLFWAMRGAGPSFAIATSIIYKTYPAPESVTDYKFFRYMTIQEAVAALTTFQTAISENDRVPKELGLQFRVDKGNDTTHVKLTVAGSYYGPESTFKRDIEPFLKGIIGLVHLNPTSAGVSGLGAATGTTNIASTSGDAQSFSAFNPDIFFATDHGASVTGDYFKSVFRMAGDPTITGDSVAYAKALQILTKFAGVGFKPAPGGNTAHLISAAQAGGKTVLSGSTHPAVTSLAAHTAANRNQPDPPEPLISFYIKTLMTPDLSTPAIETFVKYCAEEGFNTNLDWYVAIKLLGGVDSQLKNAEPAAFAWKDATWFMEFNADAYVVPYPEHGYSFLDNMVRCITTTMPNTTFGPTALLWKPLPKISRH